MPAPIKFWAIHDTICEASSKLAEIYSIPADGMTIYQAVQVGKMVDRMHRNMNKNLEYIKLQAKVNNEA